MAVRPVAFKKQQTSRKPTRPSLHLFDTHPEVRLDFSHVRDALKQGYSKPFLLIDTAIVRNKVRRFKAAMPRVHPHYAVKANPDPRVLKALIEEGVGFEIASIAELDLLLKLKVPAAEVYYSNPVKSRDSIRYAAAKGVEWFVLDSVEELRKIHGDQARRQALRSDRSSQHRQRLAALRQVRHEAGRGRRGDRRGRSAQGRSGGRDFSRRLSVPQPRKLAGRHPERQASVQEDAAGGSQAPAAQYWAAVTRCAT